MTLETGWLADTPVHDTVLRQFLFNQADHNEVIAAAHGGRSDRTDDVFLADTGVPIPYYNQAILARPVLDATDPVLDAVEEFFDIAGRATPCTILSIWPSPDLTQRGWSLVGHPAIVIRGPGPVPDHDAPGVEIRVAKDSDDLRTAERVAIEGYPMEEAAGAPPGSLFPDRLLGCGLTVRVGLVDSEPAAIGNSFVAHGLVNLALGATLPAARRRGVWRSLVWARVAEAPELPAVAYTSDDSRPGFIRMGFMPITRFTMWLR